nr:MAG TPA: peptidoglycan hydrolase [Caudoviricetes sp.]
MAKTNTGLVEYAKAQRGKPYWYGCFGQLSTKALYTSKKKQYPNQYTWNCPANQLGIKVHDCVGLIKGYLWCDSATDTTPTYNASQDVSANGMLEKCKQKGTITTMPDIPGILVFMPGHVGVYIGGGYVIEAKGHVYGVVKTKLAGRGWKSWGKCPWITYEETSDKPKTTTSGKKTIDEVAKEVIDGKWGVGEYRKKRLKAAGYNAAAVQKRVNKILAGAKTTAKKSVTEIAKEVIAGKWGNGDDRVKRLTAAGYDAKAVQKEVNRLLK